MNTATQAASPSGIRIEFNANGSIRRMDHGDIMLNLSLGNEAEGGLANIHLRRLGEGGGTIPLIGPGSPASYQTDERGLFALGIWGDLVFRLRLVLAESASAWFWHVELENTGSSAVTCDLIHTQDLALAHYGAIRLNEYYVSQYVDHTPLEHTQKGCAVASRQNQSMGGRCPWTLIGSLGRGVGYATDALQIHGLVTRAGGEPIAFKSGLPGKRLQHEHSMVSIQDESIVLAPGAKANSGFFGWFETDKQTATSADDAKRIEAVLALPEAASPQWPASTESPQPAESLFTSAPLLESLPLEESAVTTFFPGTSRHAEREDGSLLSFFTGKRSHVVLKSKELRVLRPHGHCCGPADLGFPMSPPSRPPHG
jgi:cellobiose phosphorylase